MQYVHFSRFFWLGVTSLIVVAEVAVAEPGAASAAIWCPTAYGEQPALSPRGDLTLDDVIGAVRAASPELRIAVLTAVAAHHDAEQAARKFNPVLSLETENFAGGAPFGGFNQTESTFSLNQTFRLGDKRRLGARAAEARAAVADSSRLVVLRAAELEAARRFYELAAATSTARFADEILDVSETFEEAVEHRVIAGKSPPTDLARTRATTAMARAAAADARAATAATRYALARVWGESTPSFDNPVVDLGSRVSLPVDAAPSTLIESHPRFVVAASRESARRAELQFSRSLAYPDLTVGLGVRRFEAGGGDALVANVNLPLPLFNRNQDAIKASRVRIDGAEASIVATRLALTANLAQALARAEGAELRRASLVDDALPAAIEAERGTRQGYDAGKFNLTTALDARTALIDVQVEAIRASLAARLAETEARALASVAPFDVAPCPGEQR